MRKFIHLFLLSLLGIIASCEKDITVKLPKSEPKLVVEGSIEQGQPPIVVLTRTIGYFEPADIKTMESLFVHNADITVSNGTVSRKLIEICTNDLPDSVVYLIAQLSGLNVNQLAAINYCVYTTFDQSIWGEVGKTYDLTIHAEGKTLTSTTTIPNLIPLDSVWYKNQGTYDTMGYVWIRLTDPPELGNAYRVFTKRRGKDARMIPILGSVFDDKFINGITIDFYAVRGREFNSLAPDDTGEQFGYYKISDTIDVKFCNIDINSFQFWRTYESEVTNNGNPFASPSTITTNIKGGGLGIWCGYGANYYTIIPPN